MIDDKVWGVYRFGGGTLEYKEMLDALNETFECPRCGRGDLPLALAPHHNKSCRFECGFGMPALDKVEQLQQELQDAKDKIEDLEGGVREGLRVIHWFGGWLNGRTKPVTYDDARCTCGHRGTQHNGIGRCMDPDNVTIDDDGCECDQYTPTSYSVSYAARDVARCVNGMKKLLPPDPPATEKWCKGRCGGRFDIEHMNGDLCTWCHKSNQ